MTTSVIINAHLSTSKEVFAQIIEDDKIIEEIILQNGETAHLVVFDSRKIVVLERIKNTE